MTWSRSAWSRLRKPKPTFSRTFSHGKTPFSWKTKIRRRSGPRTGSSSTSASPKVASRKPATILSKVDFPQPLGPTMQTNSPCATSALTFSKTSICSPARLPGKLIETLWMETAEVVTFIRRQTQTSNTQHPTSNSEDSLLSLGCLFTALFSGTNTGGKNANELNRFGKQRIDSVGWKRRNARDETQPPLSLTQLF